MELVLNFVVLLLLFFLLMKSVWNSVVRFTFVHMLTSWYSLNFYNALNSKHLSTYVWTCICSLNRKKRMHYLFRLKEAISLCRGRSTLCLGLLLWLLWSWGKSLFPWYSVDSTKEMRPITLVFRGIRGTRPVTPLIRSDRQVRAIGCYICYQGNFRKLCTTQLFTHAIKWSSCSYCATY